MRVHEVIGVGASLMMIDMGGKIARA